MSAGTQTFVTSDPVTPQLSTTDRTQWRPSTLTGQTNCHVHHEGTLMDVPLQLAGAVPGRAGLPIHAV